MLTIFAREQKGVIMPIDKELLEELCKVPAISGREDRLISLMKDRFKASGIMEEIRVDKLGNVIGKLFPPEEEEDLPTIVVFAHMDEVGLMVNKVEQNGFLRVEKVGSPNRKTLLGQPVLIEGSDSMVEGVVGVKSYHFQEPENRYSVPHIRDLYIDIGTKEATETLSLGVDVGSMVTYKPNFSTTHNGSHVISKALDNRIGCYQLVELGDSLADSKLHAQIYLVASVQEEFNLQGVLPAMELQPDVGLALDIYPSCDTPDLQGVLDIGIGDGPVLTLLDFHGRGTVAGLVVNPKLISYLQTCAENVSVNVQKAARGGILTDASYSQFRGDGVIMGTVSVPTRYAHSPREMAHCKDIEDMTSLLKEFLTKIGTSTVKRFQRG